MRLLPVETCSDASPEALAAFMTKGTRRPVVLTDAIEHWPARRKWTFDYFATNHSLDGGMVSRDMFNLHPGKLSTLGSYIRWRDRPLADMPGFWTDADGGHQADPPSVPMEEGWNFSWDAFGKHPELRDDFMPFPTALQNAVVDLSDEDARLLEQILHREFYSIYIARSGTISPMHEDHSKTFGYLAQFQGRKLVSLIDPETCSGADLTRFDPEQPDYACFPAAADAAHYSCVLEPGQSILLPPGWLHRTRCLDACITLSCNFFNRFNFDEFYPQLERKFRKRDIDPQKATRITQAVEKSLHPGRQH